MINYSNYKVDDYLSDESFRQWVRNGGFRNEDSVWSQRLKQNPALTSEAMKAREIILAINIDEKPFAEDYFETIRKETLIAVNRKKQNFIRPLFWRVAAAVVLMAGLLGWYVQNHREGKIQPTETSAIASVKDVKFIKTNNSESILPFELPDGSSVLLHPHSNLEYEKFPGGNRMVHLTGKAFFEVTKDPHCPFLVYSGEMVTKVLGTSFTITAYEKDADFSVVVKTGKVAVSSIPDENTATSKSAGSTINLVPNEQLVFNREKMHFIRKDLQKTEMLKYVPATENSYAFIDYPVTDIFKRIADAYGLKIDIDPTVFEGCELTTNLTDEPLFEKLNIVCNSVGPATSYVVEDGHIRVISQGCNQ